ncbi:SWI/SNF-related matrix-associated actin-dependent regulator of chromatin subfamily A-like protein 1 [Fistulifera solaris]|uniref:SWI/SNF-related matrix-associated actin-dependent regulator of chromatin subfamily A-like protein 1 n=1 Tax=Fistulifera solaris TaxID=1519565 RepID=A0A1Z5KG23_FISSO|nr:SWI/SNF-related matrix-associated actin-dependent regulator of chromatin subfamily A-like protein 1 [Fistulifera solaris]|eukprot:GAX25243.1 SWI/SNF-related matrix-associated actin-dependent regulator of chromatin subfamily A-like protein 1 [Fistulifera solaris]
MDANTDTPVAEVLPNNTAIQGEESSGTAIRETPAEAIINVPVAPIESALLQLHPKKPDVTDQVTDIADNEDTVIPAIVHVAIAEDLTSGKSELISDSLIEKSAVVPPTVTEIHVDTSAIEASPSASAKMNTLEENARIGEHSFTPASPADNNQDPIHSNIVTTLQYTTKSTQDEQFAEGKETLTEKLPGTKLALPTEDAASKEHLGQVSRADLDDAMPNHDSAVETIEEATPPISSVPVRALVHQEDTEALRQASSSTVQSEELPAYGDPLMVQEAALLDIGEDPQKTLNTPETKSPLIGEIDYSEIMENQQNNTDSIPMEHQNSYDDPMVQEAALLDVQNSPPSCPTQHDVSGQLGVDGQNTLQNEVHNKGIADEDREPFTAESQMKSTESDDHIIISVDDDTDSGEGSIEDIAPADSLARKRPRIEPQPGPFSKPPGHRPPMPVTNHGGLSIGSARLPVVPHQRPHSIVLNTPEYLEFHNFTPTWNQLLPSPQKSPKNERRLFRLSLLNVNEFTIIGLPVQFAFASFLQSDPLTSIEGIPQHQLHVASVERARQAQGYPSAEQLQEKGLPLRLAKALAPFQRGGVDFVLSKDGRAMIADDMGLGKTIQAIASMSIYFQEWPLLVLCPSSARYHWESEFLLWLGKDSDNSHDDNSSLSQSQINDLSTSKDEIFPSQSTKVIICSYGLVTTLVESRKITPGMFDCAIVDESHMLKNKSSKRTSRLLPVLTATKRCVLLSGTPALARPAELWPQLLILGTERHGWWDDEAAFVDKYVRNGNAESSAELHTMLTGTVMIRRLKADILKSLPRKLREKASFQVLGPNEQLEFKDLLAKLRQGKGTLGQLARIEHHLSLTGPNTSNNAQTIGGGLSTEPVQCEIQDAIKSLEAQVERSEMEGRIRIQNTLNQVVHQLSQDRYEFLKMQLESDFNSRIESQLKQGMDAIASRFGQNHTNQHESKRTRVLARLYERTGQVKIPIIVDILKRWLNDPTKGKLCIFAHHLSVLDAIRDLADLSNRESDGKYKFIRIDGSTNPKQRQEQIQIFQTDPTTRIALLGITAAGVAVTLTASSTVWFAELFWTPAIMIQAEDRCHRIGQQARVQCLYFVARGTIDDILWRLIEKKFTDLGEFVEGKENHKLVVDKTYHTVKELHDHFQGLDVGQDEDLLYDAESGEDFLQLDSDLVHDIEMLGDEEQRMLQVSADDDEVAPDSETIFKDLNEEFCNAKPAPLNADSLPKSSPTKEHSGQTEDDAIALSDDEEEDKKVAATEVDKSSASPSAIDSRYSFCGETCRAYRIILKGPSLGLTIENYKGRIVVSKVSPGAELSKPSVVNCSMGQQNSYS